MPNPTLDVRALLQCSADDFLPPCVARAFACAMKEIQPQTDDVADTGVQIVHSLAKAMSSYARCLAEYTSVRATLAEDDDKSALFANKVRACFQPQAMLDEGEWLCYEEGVSWRIVLAPCNSKDDTSSHITMVYVCHAGKHTFTNWLTLSQPSTKTSVLLSPDVDDMEGLERMQISHAIAVLTSLGIPPSEFPDETDIVPFLVEALLPNSVEAQYLF